MGPKRAPPRRQTGRAPEKGGVQARPQRAPAPVAGRVGPHYTAGPIVGLQGALQQQIAAEEEPEEEALQPQLVQRQPAGEEDEDLIQRCACSGPCSCHGQEQKDPHQQGAIQRQPTDEEEEGETVQAKLAVMPAGDRYEREADSVAERITSGRMAPPITPLRGDSVRATQSQMEEDDETEETLAQTLLVQRQALQTNAAVDANARLDDRVAQAIRNPSGGKPLRPQVRGPIETNTGIDMSDVRVHRDDAAMGGLRARALTHGTHIWLRSGESPDDLKLMAHEATHVIQQESARGAVQTIQRAPADYQHPQDGGNVRARLRQHFEEKIDDSERDDQDTSAAADASRSSRRVDRAELRERSSELEDDTEPDVDRPQQEAPNINQSANEVKQEAESPPDPLVEGEGEEQPEAEEGASDEASSAAEQAASLADQAFAAATSQPEPPDLAEVEPPQPIIAPVDSAGEPLEADLAADNAVLALAERAQYLREQGALMRSQAVEGHSNAEITKGNLARVKSEVSKAEEGITTSQEYTRYRREVVDQSKEALAVSKEKQAKVVAGAPDYQSKADEGKEDTGPMSSEASNLASENAAKTPEDPEAAAKSREQGQKINRVSDQAQTMDRAVSQTRSRADSLVADAARAAEMNAQTESKIGDSQNVLDQTDTRLSEMESQAGQAKTQLESMAGQPDDLHARAQQLNNQGQALENSSVELEAKLHSAQSDYAAGTSAVPELEPWDGQIPEDELPEAEAAGVIPSQEDNIASAEDELLAAEETDIVQLQEDNSAAAEAEPEPTSSADAEPPLGSAIAEEVAETPPVTESARESGIEPGVEEEAAPTTVEEPQDGDIIAGEADEESSETPAVGGAEGEAVAALPPDPELEPLPERESVGANEELPSWLTGIDQQSTEERNQAAQAQRKQRRQDIQQIQDWANGRPISQLSAGERTGLALRLVGQRYYNSVANIQWPGWGNLAKALLDPRSMLQGAISGMNMILSGGANLFSAEAWQQDPLGNLLKSAADIATGLAIILGSITALAGIVAAIMGALILITFGAASPVALPVISICTTIITTVGGWTIAVGKIALVLQALSLIKNLIDAATASTAAELEREAGEIQSDINGGFQAAMSIVGAKGTQAGIRQVRSRTAGVVRASRRAGGARALARQTGRAVRGRARAVRRGIAASGRRAVAGARALPGRVAMGARTLPGRVAAGGRRAAAGARALGGRAVSGARALPGRAAAGARTLPGRVAAGGRRAAAGARALGTRTLASARELGGRAISGARALPGRVAAGARALPGRTVRGVTGGARRFREDLRTLGRSFRRGGRDLRRGVRDLRRGRGRRAGLARRPDVDSDLARIPPVNDETADMLANNPSLRRALADNPRAARALRLCRSLCIPENANPAQVRRLEELFEEMAEAGLDVSPSNTRLRNYFHQNRHRLDDAIDDLEDGFRSSHIAARSGLPDVDADDLVPERGFSTGTAVKTPSGGLRVDVDRPPRERIVRRSGRRADRGFDPQTGQYQRLPRSEVYVYQLVDENKNVVRYGVTNDPSRRVGELGRELGGQFHAMEVISDPVARAQGLSLETALIIEDAPVLNRRQMTLAEMKGGAAFFDVVEIPPSREPTTALLNPRR